MGNAARVINDLEEKRRKEIINGEIVMMSPPRVNHLQVSGNIYHLFRNFLVGKPCRIFPDGIAVNLAEDNQFIPDAAVVCDRGKIEDSKINGAPDLVVEILSQSTAHIDHVQKKKAYEKYGVREYWIVNIESRFVEVYILREGVLELEHVYTTYPTYPIDYMDEVDKAQFLVKGFYSTIFPDLYVSFDELFFDVT